MTRRWPQAIARGDGDIRGGLGPIGLPTDVACPGPCPDLDPDLSIPIRLVAIGHARGSRCLACPGCGGNWWEL